MIYFDLNKLVYLGLFGKIRDIVEKILRVQLDVSKVVIDKKGENPKTSVMRPGFIDHVSRTLNENNFSNYTDALSMIFGVKERGGVLSRVGDTFLGPKSSWKVLSREDLQIMGNNSETRREILLGSDMSLDQWLRHPTPVSYLEGWELLDEACEVIEFMSKEGFKVSMASGIPFFAKDLLEEIIRPTVEFLDEDCALILRPDECESSAEVKYAVNNVFESDRVLKSEEVLSADDEMIIAWQLSKKSKRVYFVGNFPEDLRESENLKAGGLKKMKEDVESGFLYE